MDSTDEKFREVGEAIQTLTERLIGLSGDLVKLRHTVIALEATLAVHISPDDPKAGLKQLRDLERQIAAKDPSAKLHQEVSAMAEAVRLMEKHGGPEHS